MKWSLNPLDATLSVPVLDRLEEIESTSPFGRGTGDLSLEQPSNLLPDQERLGASQ